MSHSAEDTAALAVQVRCDVLEMVHRARAAHVGSSLSVVDILAVLYGRVLRHRPEEPMWPDRDRLILSKGHAAAAGYAVLARTGYFSPELLDTYCENDSPLAGHLTAAAGAPGVEMSTGSLGHGLPVGTGMALYAKRTGMRPRVFVVMSDGEMDEGTTWEAALFGAHHRLDNLCAIVDFNQIQSYGRVEDVLRLEPLVDKWRSFGWNVSDVDGHDHNALADALARVDPERPHMIVARTIKGKGVSFMEDQLLWHYRSPDDVQLARALAEVRGAR
jgi:transketolase